MGIKIGEWTVERKWGSMVRTIGFDRVFRIKGAQLPHLLEHVGLGFARTKVRKRYENMDLLSPVQGKKDRRLGRQINQLTLSTISIKASPFLQEARYR